jgi:hypothetical protein
VRSWLLVGLDRVSVFGSRFFAAGLAVVAVVFVGTGVLILSAGLY